MALQAGIAGVMPSHTAFNREFHDEFWRSCPDFSRYHPGARHRRRWILNTLKRIRFDSLLDVGCGDAELLLLLRSHFPSEVEFVGADLAPATMTRNRERHAFARFEVLDLQQAALDRTFGVVVCSEVIEHLDGQPRAIANAARMVAPEGYLLITCPTGKVHATERRFGHVRHPTAVELERSVTDAGLEIVVSENWGFPTYSALKYATNLNSSWALRNFGTTTYSLGGKLVCHLLTAANFLNIPSSSLGCQLFLLARRPSVQVGANAAR